MKNEKKIFYFFWILYTVALITVAICTDGTGGGGDSVLHFLYAKYAFLHPELFLNHWAKPLFTILSSPFTLVGFNGIKLFNVICSSAAVWFGYQIMEKWQISYRWAIAPIIFSSSLFMAVTLSGLTEPLSALILTSAIYFISIQQIKTGLIVVSFMPFVRSEGLIILGVFFIYTCIKRHYKFVPLLFIGHIIFAVIGYSHYRDILWIFTKIPYANQVSIYGSGSWEHFIIQINFQTSPIIYTLFWIGSITLLLKLIISSKKITSKEGFTEHFWLVYGNFYAFLISHATFWALGIFNSMGLVRVFVSVMPLMVIICIDGLNVINSFYFKKYNHFIVYLVVTVIIIIPFTEGKYKHDIPDDFLMSKEQTIIKDSIKPYLMNCWKDKTIVFTDPNVPFMLNLDPFDSSQCLWHHQIEKPNNLPDDRILVADVWFSKTEWGYPIDSILKDSGIILHAKFPKIESIYYVFGKK